VGLIRSGPDPGQKPSRVNQAHVSYALWIVALVLLAAFIAALVIR
jgi:hypothetical protein